MPAGLIALHATAGLASPYATADFQPMTTGSQPCEMAVTVVGSILEPRGLYAERYGVKGSTGDQKTATM